MVEQYVKKGAKVYIEGALQTRKWQGQDGQDRYSTEVVLQGFNSVLTMLDARGGAGAGASAGMHEDDQAGYTPPATATAPSGQRAAAARASTSPSTTRSRSEALASRSALASMARRASMLILLTWGLP